MQKKTVITILGALLLGIVVLMFFVITNYGFKETTITYLTATNLNSETSEVEFYCADYNEIIKFEVPADYVDRLRSVVDYEIKRRENNGTLDYKIEITGLITGNNKTYTKIGASTKTASISSKEIYNKVGITGSVDEENIINYKIGKNSFSEYVSKDYYDSVSNGENIRVLATEYRNSNKSTVIQYRIVEN